MAMTVSKTIRHDSHASLFPLMSLRPAPRHYFPSMHQLKYEVEDGITPNSRPVRFGFDPRVFPGYSWRGYAVLSPAQVGGVMTL